MFPRIGIIEVSFHKELQTFWEILRVEQFSSNQLTSDLQALYVSCMQCLLSLGDAQPMVLDTIIHSEYQREQKPGDKSHHSVLELRQKSSQVSKIPKRRANVLANWSSHTRQTLQCGRAGPPGEPAIACLCMFPGTKTERAQIWQLLWLFLI